MTLCVPYWWSKECYDICNDDVRGGWKTLWLRIRLSMERDIPMQTRIHVTVAFGIGNRFSRQ